MLELVWWGVLDPLVLMLLASEGSKVLLVKQWGFRGALL